MLVVLAVLAFACGPRSASSRPPSTPRLAHPQAQASPIASEHEQVALVLQITVDQLRADLSRRYLERLDEGGLRRLWTEGVVYTNAHHEHAVTETIVGHSTLATGAHPAVHGMIGNVWLDQSTGETAYNIEDTRYSLLGAVAGSAGRSPRSLLVSTFSDELMLSSSGLARVFAISVKDRGAVPMAGHAGKAFWFSKKTGGFVTSSYYYTEPPRWLTGWNQRDFPKLYAGKTWELVEARTSYQFANADAQPWEIDVQGFGRTFPHSYGDGSHPAFNTWLTMSPAGDELTARLAEAVIESEHLGADQVTDYLSVSLSSTDYVGHFFGPSSLEAEDNLLRLDRTLRSLLRAVDQRIGLDRTLVVLSSDHGVSDAPAVLEPLGIEARHVDPDKVVLEPATQALERRFTRGKELIQAFVAPYVYLNRQRIAERKLDAALVEQEVARALRRQAVVEQAVTRSELVAGSLPDAPVLRAVRHNFHPGRSGDVHVVFKPYHFIADFGDVSFAANHGSPFNYDTHVPIVLMGPGIAARLVERRVETVSLAPTLSLYLGIALPSGAFDEPLHEVLSGG